MLLNWSDDRRHRFVAYHGEIFDRLPDLSSIDRVSSYSTLRRQSVHTIEQALEAQLRAFTSIEAPYAVTCTPDASPRSSFVHINSCE